MHAKLGMRFNEMLGLIESSMNTEVVMLVVACAFLVVLSVVVGCVISRINQEKINTLQIFLSITEQQIQKFSSKT
jgi:hypothetical protein